MNSEKANRDYKISFTVSQTPEQVFEAIMNVRGWWSEEIEGKTDQLNAEFVFHYQDLHRSRQKIVEFIPNEKITWLVSESKINFVKQKSEWDETKVIFETEPKGDRTELHFTHQGLNKKLECYDGCSDAWGFYIRDSLKNLITKGIGKPNKKE